MAVTIIAASDDEPSGRSLVGNRVVKRYGNFPLRVNDEPVVASGLEIQVYRVERANGNRLWLEPDDEASTGCGWSSTDQVVAIDRAADYFRQRVERYPNDLFPYIARAGSIESKDFE